ncbi:putative methyltransferase-domain-containing protein [Exophiala viscosa]|uniref:Methyltransferase-domain-containing protein n=1 Tax=Exophiala viscosa TaxID=2486360 RepID=A0AAN6E752_9EURO|nr:putative methyltransferase-domain-containing protein [Exophiala viscosa]KAI1628237.1 putative methyltransferase-domain-containing protein [Exophiala viscosa]
MSRTFKVPRDHDSFVDIHISEPDLRADNLTLTTWTSSFVLAGILHKLDVDYSCSNGIPVLELGAGTGLVGLTIAALWKARVILTDLPPIVPGLAANVKLNNDSVKDLVQCGSLDWTTPESLVLQTGQTYAADVDKAQVVVAADVVYSEEHPELLSGAIIRWLGKGPSSRVIIACAQRVAYLEQLRELWELLEAGGLEAVDEGREQAEVADWDDEGLIEWSVWRWKASDTSAVRS